MHVYISCDMEGATGVVGFDQVEPGSAGYAFGRAMQRHDLLAVVHAALEAGATRILVNDAHENMNNLDSTGFPTSVELCSGSQKVLSMVEGVDECQVAFFVCYHAMAGTEKAVTDHTMSRIVHDVRLNGRCVGETGINAAVCGFLGVPVALVTGDQAVCLEAESLLGEELVTCAIKEGRSASAARLLPPERTEALLREATRRAMERALSGKAPLFPLQSPYRMELEFSRSSQCDAACIVPGSRRFSGRGLMAENEDMLELYRWFRSAVNLAESA
ncbi:M55 family metallopeptidase [Aminiphilus circumscriptus]|uniref:M55 family metallopeptidase n=1 Tax=Aminiphilus circumscriptus TaxID=290732 RepID=UPI0004926050|nr:M55 family metallopeptidase [Aminiphilus circumscriptus]